MSNKLKDWTVLIYANGNNELEPEIWQSKLDAEKVGSTPNINVIIQIGRESRKLVKMIRPKDTIPFTNEVWTGVRRYFISKHQSVLINDLGKVNMADHKALYDFIVWGIKEYPAKKCMLVISGHGSSFIAVLPDLSQDTPYMMGVSEMCKIINKVKSDTGSNIDILVLDICYMNIIEIIYELGKDKDHTVNSLLTYIKRGPINGVPYSQIIESIRQNTNILDTNSILKNMVESINLDLVAIQINHNKLKRIKELINELAYLCLINNQESLDLFNSYNKSLEKMLSSIILYSKTLSQTDAKPIEITTRDKYTSDRIDAFLPYYYKLSFSRNNYWTHILSNKCIDEKISFFDSGLSIFEVAPNGLKNLIWSMNPVLSEEDINTIVDKVYDFKQWTK